MNGNRQEDLTRVFDRTWNANHNNGVKEAREKEKKFMNRLFNVKEKEQNVAKSITPNMQAQNLQNNINGATKFQRQSQINGILKKWK